MTLGAVSFSGLSSGVDWRSMIDKLIEVDHKRVDLVSQRKSVQEQKLKAWKDLASKLQGLKSQVDELRKLSSFDLFKTSLTSSSSTEANKVLSATANQYAVPGTHEIQVIQTAQAQKLSSKSFSSRKDPLGASYAGSIVLGGKLLTIDATDTLETLRDKINNLNLGSGGSGITASIISYSSTDHRLILTSQAQGSQGMDIRAVGSVDVLAELGFTIASSQIRYPTTSGAKSALFSSSTSPVASLLGLSGPIQGNVTIGGQALTIDLSSSLSEIASQIDALDGVSASVVSEVGSDGITRYRLDIRGTSSFSDSNNVLHTLGILGNTFGAVQEIHTSSTSLTKIGGGYLDATTTWAQLDTGGGANTISNGDTITITGKKHDGTTVSAVYTITDKNSQTLQGLLDAIEGAFGDVSASVTSDGKIQVTDNIGGTSALQVMLRANNEGGGDLDLGEIRATQKGYQMEVVQGKDAILTIDGGYVTKSSNSIGDVIPGVTLDLLKAEPGTTITLSVTRDTDSIISKIKGFVDKYNAVMDFIVSQSRYKEDKEKPSGALFGEGTLSSVKSELMSNLVSRVWGVSAEFSIPAMVGIKLDNDGKLSVDETLLKGYLTTNLEDVRSLFTVRGNSTSGSIRFLGHGLKTKPGTYTVTITQPATQAQVTGTVDLSGGLGGQEILTITSGNSSARISLGEGMSLAEIVAAINQETQASYSQVIVGDARLYSDSAASQPITANTVWADIHNASGEPAGLQDGDVIRFSGTDRRGRLITGSYTINHVGTDKVEGLLSAIEAAFGGSVDAYIDSSGRVVVADREAGPSSLSLNITGPEGRNLSFGTIDVDPTGSDGSRQGRYSLPVLASASQDGKYLVLTHRDYGSSQSFQVTQQNGILLGQGLDGTYSGQDVSGTIGGESATGQGRILRGNSGQPNVDGLSIIYTGTRTGDVGTLTVTMGVAEGFYRSLFQMVDTFEGYITNKQNSIQSQIDRLSQQIEDMEAELDRKRTRMIQQFVAMEKVISKLQTQMNWLGQQITAMGKR